MKTWILILLTATALSAQIPYGREFQVNSGYNGSAPAVTALTGGGFVVCWYDNERTKDDHSIYARLYGADGGPTDDEFKVSNRARDCGHGIASLADGGFVVCWISDEWLWNEEEPLFAQRYRADGSPKGEDFSIIGSNTIDYFDAHLAIAGLADGGFVVCWQVKNANEKGDYIHVQRFGADSEPAGPYFRINSEEHSPQGDRISVDGLINGGFVVAWEAENDLSYQDEIYVRCFGVDGEPQGNKICVTSEIDDEKYCPSVAALSDGGFVVGWENCIEYWSYQSYIAWRRYSADGTSVGGPFFTQKRKKGEPYYGNESFPTIAGLRDGGFAISWTVYENYQILSYIETHIYTPHSNELSGREFAFGEKDELRGGPKVAGLADSGFVVIWPVLPERFNFNSVLIHGRRFPPQQQRHALRPFSPIEPEYDATVNKKNPKLNWQPASDLTVAYPWELAYTVLLDTQPDFSTAKIKTIDADTSMEAPELNAGKTYFWKVLAKTYYGDSLWSDVSAFFVSHTATGVEEAAVPGQFAVLSNYPNPFNPSTTIRFELPKDGYVTLKIYDISGRLVKALLSGEQTAGSHTAVWDGADDAGHKVAAGVYFYQLEFTGANGVRQALTQKMSLVK